MAAEWRRGWRRRWAQLVRLGRVPAPAREPLVIRSGTGGRNHRRIPRRIPQAPTCQEGLRMPNEPSAAPPPQDQPDSPPVPPAGLVLVSTPIGNLGDITMRARAALAAADLVLCEDTRHTARLLGALGISTRMQALHEHNEDAAIPALLARLAQGQCIAL